MANLTAQDMASRTMKKGWTTSKDDEEEVETEYTPEAARKKAAGREDSEENTEEEFNRHVGKLKLKAAFERRGAEDKENSRQSLKFQDSVDATRESYASGDYNSKGQYKPWGPRATPEVSARRRKSPLYDKQED